MSDRYDPSLLPALVHLVEDWQDQPAQSLWTFANYKAGMELGYAFASIFMPELLRHRGGVFIAAQFTEESFDQWMETLDGDLTRVELVMNHCHLGDFFLNSPSDDELDLAVYKKFGEVLRSCWQTAAMEAYPDLPIRVGWNGDDDSDDEYQVTLYLDRQ